MPGWRITECYGGWYWEVFLDGVKVNGGIADDRLMAAALAQYHLHSKVIRLTRAGSADVRRKVTRDGPCPAGAVAASRR